MLELPLVSVFPPFSTGFLSLILRFPFTFGKGSSTAGIGSLQFLDAFAELEIFFNQRLYDQYQIVFAGRI